MATNRSLVHGAAAAVLAIALITSALFADSSGRTGRTSTGCTCHGSVNTGVTVTVSGPQTVAPLSTHDYTVSVTGGPSGTLGGFNLKASAGTLAAGTGNRVSGSEVTHSNRNSRSWTFSWTAPATSGAQSFVTVGLGCDGNSSTSGDAWNYYGGAANAAFAIDVSASLGVPGTPAASWLAPPVPNPCRREAQVEFSLASAGSARVEVLDLSGRRVATLMDGALPAGRRSVRWDRRSDNGSRAASGLYFVRLVSGSESITTRLLVVD